MQKVMEKVKKSPGIWINYFGGNHGLEEKVSVEKRPFDSYMLLSGPILATYCVRYSHSWASLNYKKD